ncbi:hypothetical protein [Actinomadura craniellae]|uniref:hypothetical protein n=1 Tax=Actinomadura craniellae TaxID=2231787 RepID=UPI001314F62E|nr:hypothetical protein [Actinomadura craniellae]
MSDNLIETVAPHLAPPITRQPGGTAADSGEGADLAMMCVMPMMFAGDDDD